MSGTVKEVMVKPGDKVVKNQPVAVIVAMKLEVGSHAHGTKEKKKKTKTREWKTNPWMVVALMMKSFFTFTPLLFPWDPLCWLQKCVLVAPRDGVVAEVMTVPDQQVKEGQSLATLVEVEKAKKQ